MANYYVGDTIICSCEVTNASGTLVDPDTSMKINISGPGAGISDTNMTKDSVGKYHYDFDSSGKPVGGYVAKFTAVDGSRTVIEKSSFTLV